MSQQEGVPRPPDWAAKNLQELLRTDSLTDHDFWLQCLNLSFSVTAAEEQLPPHEKLDSMSHQPLVCESTTSRGLHLETPVSNPELLHAESSSGITSPAPLEPAPILPTKLRRKRPVIPAKQITDVPEVIVVDPPALPFHDADERTLLRLTWMKSVSEMLPPGILIAVSPRRSGGHTVQRYTPCRSWQEFFEGIRGEKESKEKKTVAERRSLRVEPKRLFKPAEKETRPSDPVGAGLNAIVEVYGDCLDALEFETYNFFSNFLLLPK